jgi:hypothetical protein
MSLHTPKSWSHWTIIQLLTLDNIFDRLSVSLYNLFCFVGLLEFFDLLRVYWIFRVYLVLDQSPFLHFDVVAVHVIAFRRDVEGATEHNDYVGNYDHAVPRSGLGYSIAIDLNKSPLLGLQIQLP